MGEQTAKRAQKAKPPQLAIDVREIPVTSITIGEQMLRHTPDADDIIELAADIASHGLMQPIGVYAIDDNHYQLLWGSRRLAAHQRLQRTNILARLCDPQTTETIIATAARENLLRRDLTLREEIDAIRRLTTDGRSPSQISDLVGKSRDWVNRRLAFDSLPPDIRDHVLEGALPLGHAEVLALVEEPGTRSYFLTHCLQHHPSLATLRSLLEAVKQTPTFEQAVTEGTQAYEQATSNPSFHYPCHICDALLPIATLVIVRACPACATALAHSAAPEEHTHATN